MDRPGGGQSFSGGGGGGGFSGGGGGFGGGSYTDPNPSSSSSSSSSGPMPIELAVIVLAFIVVFFLYSSSKKQEPEWSTIAPRPEPKRRKPIPRSRLDRIRARDPEFSSVLFEDFVYLLYAELQRGRAKGAKSIAPYLTASVRGDLRVHGLKKVDGIVIGSMRLVRLDLEPRETRITLEIESNYTEHDADDDADRFWAIEQLELVRDSKVKSRPWKYARTLDCPNCGAPLQSMRGTTCEHCNEDIGHGRFDWMVASWEILDRKRTGPLLTSDVEERGTDAPTIVSDGARARRDEIEGFVWDDFKSRVKKIFKELGRGWSGRDALVIRPWVSDALFQSMVYWIDLYVEEKCRNMHDGARITKIELAEVIRDAHYDAITIRISARGKDYTIDERGKLLSGDADHERVYTEYWTLVRGRAPREKKGGEMECPNCGAPLAIDMVGNCKHCSVKITAGEFDWVLSRIEQDEVYAG